jgi:dihydrofolate reductase
MKLSLIVAMSENRVIGRGGQLPWRLSADLRRFKQLTMGHHIVMGRKTWESIGRPLPGRTSLVISRDPAYQADGAQIVSDLRQAFQAADGDDEVFIIGGGQIYRQALPSIDRIYLTLIHARIDGDTEFPELDTETWRLLDRSCRYPADQKNDHDHSFLVYERVGPGHSVSR